MRRSTYVSIPVFALVLLTAFGARSLESYSPAQSEQFMDWCTGAKSATESTCSCTLKSVAQTVPAATLAQFLTSQASGGSFNFNASLASTGAMVASSLASCASR
ncbi:MAG: hypothetical protein HOH04_16730 [Rhodospirillaceae bacterium]|nr:hypothetical protein [Rhodospirillaceae bacterium]